MCFQAITEKDKKNEIIYEYLALIGENLIYVILIPTHQQHKVLIPTHLHRWTLHEVHVSCLRQYL